MTFIFTNVTSFIYILLLIIVLIIIYFSIVSFLNKKRINKLIKYLSTVGIIKKENDYYVLNYNNDLFYIKFISVKKDSEIQINNKTTWQCFSKNMKSYKYLKKIDKFANINKKNKVFILVNHIKNIKFVINESEMIMVNKNVNVYDFHIIKCEEIQDYFHK